VKRKLKMDTGTIFDTTYKTLENNLDLRAKKHKLVTSNLANIDTPNFKAFNFHVEEAMNHLSKKKGFVELRQTTECHLKSNTDTGGNLKLNGIMKEETDIDIDKIMMNLSENSILYNATAQILSKKYNMLKESINGGSR
jgi:flagellar basal-body rod protein FlgB